MLQIVLRHTFARAQHDQPVDPAQWLVRLASVRKKCREPASTAFAPIVIVSRFPVFTGLSAVSTAEHRDQGQACSTAVRGYPGRHVLFGRHGRWCSECCKIDRNRANIIFLKPRVAALHGVCVKLTAVQALWNVHGEMKVSRAAPAYDGGKVGGEISDDNVIFGDGIEVEAGGNGRTDPASLKPFPGARMPADEYDLPPRAAAPAKPQIINFSKRGSFLHIHQFNVQDHAAIGEIGSGLGILLQNGEPRGDGYATSA